MKVRYSAITKADVISVIILFIAVFIFTHLPRSMEFTLTVYKFEKTGETTSTVNYDKPYEMVCSLRKWEHWFSPNIIQGMIQLDGRTYVTPKQKNTVPTVYQHGRFTLQDAETPLRYIYVSYAYIGDQVFATVTGSEYVGGQGSQYESITPIHYITQTVPEDVAAYLAP